MEGSRGEGLLHSPWSRPSSWWWWWWWGDGHKCYTNDLLSFGETGLQLEEEVLSRKTYLAFGCQKGNEGVHLLGVILLYVADHGAEVDG